MGFRRGIQANNPNNFISSEAGIKELPKILSKIKDGIQNGRVTDIVLNSDHPKFKTYGSYNGLGTIEFELINFLSGTTLSAKPFFPNTSTWPLVNELVLVFKLPYKGIGKNTSEEGYFYINMIGLWNHPHMNAYPNPITTPDLPPEQQKDYQQVEAGSTRKIATSSDEENNNVSFNSPTNPSQDTFIERSNIHPLLNFVGDVIYQGRWGNSLRFGSTVKTPSTDNNTWSETGENGDPITIIRNGQDPNSSSEGWIPITEDVNNDLASIWFTSTQKLPIEVSNHNYISYIKNKPTKPDQYTSPQVVINSDRLILNAKKDHILVSSLNSIFLGGNESINASTKSYIVDSPSIMLGKKEADQPIIKGNMFLDDLAVIMGELSVLCSTLSQIKEVSAVDVNTGKVIFTDAVKGKVAEKANSLKEMIDETLIPKIEVENGGYKSSVTKTI
jgi:hypothetical protein